MNYVPLLELIIVILYDALLTWINYHNYAHFRGPNHSFRITNY